MKPLVKTIIDINWNVTMLNMHYFQEAVQRYVALTGLNYIEFTDEKPTCIVQENDECGKIEIEKINFYKVADNWIPEIISNDDVWEYGQTDLNYFSLLVLVNQAIMAYENNKRS